MKKPVIATVIWTLMGIVTVTVSYIIKDYFIMWLGSTMLLIAALNELDIYLSRRAGVDPDKDYIKSEEDVER